MLGQMRAELDRAAQFADEGAVVLAELTAMAGETAGPDGDPYAASLSTVGRSLQFCIGFVASSAATTAEIPIFR